METVADLPKNWNQCHTTLLDYAPVNQPIRGAEILPRLSSLIQMLLFVFVSVNKWSRSVCTVGNRYDIGDRPLIYLSNRPKIISDLNLMRSLLGENN